MRTSQRFSYVIVALIMTSSSLAPLASSLSVTVNGVECVYEYVLYEGDTVTGNYVVVDHDIFWGSDHPGIDFTVSRMGFRCIGLSGIYNSPLSREDGCSMIKEAYHRRITFFDTADIDGHNHDNEIMIGKELKNLSQEKIQVATEFGPVRMEGNRVGVDGSPRYVRECCKVSINLFYSHKVDTTKPIEDAIR